MVLPGMELMNCASLAVPKEVMHHVVRVESSYNPYAIGVVGGRLARQPKTLPEALATVRMLEAKGYNFSLGLAQVNRYNLGKYGIDSYEKAFDVCPNLQTGSRILAECYNRSGGDWGKSLSCYYSGNFVTGYRHGYVQKIYASMRGKGSTQSAQASGDPIAVVGKPSRRMVEITRFPVYAAQMASSQRLPATHMTQAPSRSEPVQSLLPQPAATMVMPSQATAPAALTASQDSLQIQNLSVSDSPVRDGKPSGDEAFVF